MERISQAIQEWAEYQNLSGDTDTAETCSVAGNYDWRAYLREAAEAAGRDAQHKPVKKAERAPPAPAPNVFYA